VLSVFIRAGSQGLDISNQCITISTSPPQQHTYQAKLFNSLFENLPWVKVHLLTLNRALV
jgi:hypothetical protein